MLHLTARKLIGGRATENDDSVPYPGPSLERRGRGVAGVFSIKGMGFLLLPSDWACLIRMINLGFPILWSFVERLVLQAGRRRRVEGDLVQSSCDSYMRVKPQAGVAFAEGTISKRTETRGFLGESTDDAPRRVEVTSPKT